MTKLERLEKQKAHLQEMLKYERELWAAGKQYVAGIDEVGRGPLAGPVVTAAVILPHDFDVPGVDDSKKLSEKRREELYDEIMKKALAVSIGRVEPKRIDEINILEATKEAMKMALEGLSIKPDHVLIDALTLKNVDLPQTGIIHGDALSVSIAAASIIAKVTRDRLLYEYDMKYPEYGFASHKGYGTKQHYDAIIRYGALPFHRKTFLKNLHRK